MQVWSEIVSRGQVPRLVLTITLDPVELPEFRIVPMSFFRPSSRCIAPLGGHHGEGAGICRSDTCPGQTRTTTVGGADDAQDVVSVGVEVPCLKSQDEAMTAKSALGGPVSEPIGYDDVGDLPGI